MDAILALVPLADWDGHHDGGWWMMGLGMVLFWGVVIAAIVWLARDGFDRAHQRRAPSGGGRETAVEILDRRFANGDITVEEYEERRRRLERRDD